MRGYLRDDLVFEGLFETYRSADQYFEAFKGLLSITERLEVKKIIAQGNDAATFSSCKLEHRQRPPFWLRSGITSRTARSHTLNPHSTRVHMKPCLQASRRLECNYWPGA